MRTPQLSATSPPRSWGVISPRDPMRWLGPAITAASLLAVVAVRPVILSPGIPLLVAVAAAAVLGGIGPGLVSAAITTAFLLIDSSEPGHLFVYEPNEIPWLIVNVVSAISNQGEAHFLTFTQTCDTAVFLTFLFCAIATPTPDPIAMTALGSAMCLLYFGAVGAAFLNERRRAKLRSREYDGLSDDEASQLDHHPEPVAEPEPVAPPEPIEPARIERRRALTDDSDFT